LDGRSICFPNFALHFPLRELVGNVGRIKPYRQRRQTADEPAAVLAHTLLAHYDLSAQVEPNQAITIKNGNPGIGMLIIDVNATKN
jgi:redox-regulated HSP33 family molecular chaperone